MKATKSGDRASFGQVVISHKGKEIPTSVGNRNYESMFGGMNPSFPKTLGNIPLGYEHRPELIANLFLNTPKGWWIICERNAIFDVFEQLNSGDLLKLPVKL
tara:strand:+ start:45 stop:350 length:306 start_codon:yes stop_codon:yes gene_type:complete